MIRGHERFDVGFVPFFELGDVSLLSLFSAGGALNPDLPANSGYRRTTPMAATVRFQGGEQALVPWPIDWESCAYTVRNGFLREPHELKWQVE
jgi:hypothetical protein